MKLLIPKYDEFLDVIRIQVIAVIELLMPVRRRAPLELDPSHILSIIYSIIHLIRYGHRIRAPTT